MVTLSEVATRKLGEIIAQQGENVFGLRVHAMSGCCSGPSYGMSLANEAMPGDWQGEFGGVRLIVDPESAVLLEGATIDYVETPEASGFTINNPSAVSTGGGCGCGSGGGGCGSGQAQGEAPAEAVATKTSGHGGCGCGSH